MTTKADRQQANFEAMQARHRAGKLAAQTRADTTRVTLIPAILLETDPRHTTCQRCEKVHESVTAYQASRLQTRKIVWRCAGCAYEGLG